MRLKRLMFLIFWLLVTVALHSAVLIKPQSTEIYSYSGDNQTQAAGKILDNPIRILVTDTNGNPLKDHELTFTVISFPKNSLGYRIDKTHVYTDSAGIAINYFQIGDKEGVYEILVKSTEDCDANSLVFKANARKKSWVVFLIIGLLGGMALFLYGMDILSKGMQAAAGSKMRGIIGKFTRNRIAGLFAGVILTLMVQSSTASSVMLVGFVEAGLMGFVQSLSMLLGAAIGTTITAQLIALNISDYALLIVTLGFCFIVFTKKTKYKNIGKAVLGVGLLFYGMFVMSEAMYPLRDYSGFVNLLITLENPVVGIIVGFAFTALIHSSAAFIGIMITIASQGFLSIDACIPLIFGTNLGTAVTAIIVSFNSGREAQRVAFANALFRLIGIFIFVWWIPEYVELVKSISPKVLNAGSDFEMLSETVPRQIANAHTIFSIGMAIIILPFLNLLAKFTVKILPDKAKPEPFKLRYIDSAVNSAPAMALSFAKQETERMSGKIKKMVSLGLKPFIERDENVLDKWQKLENEADFLKENINKYLVSVSSQNVDKQQLNEAFQIMYVVKELEMIGDIINTNIRHQSVKWLADNAEFSEEGKAELLIMREKAMKQINRSMEVFHDLNLEKAEHVSAKFKKYEGLAEDFEKHHYKRLISNDEKTRNSSEIHLELLGLYNSISRHATNISRILMTWTE